MAGEDFYVSFGSNAAAFAKSLRAELAPARKEIQETAAMLNALAQGVGGFNQMRRLAQQGLDLQRGGGAAGGTTASGPTEQQIDVGGASKTVAALMDDLNRFGQGMDQLVTRMDALVRTFGPVTDAVAKETAARNRAAGQILSEANRNKVRDPNTGRPVSEGTPGAVPFYRAPAISEPKLANVPRGLVDEASLNRIVSAVERNVSATERVEAAINRLAGNKAAGLATSDPLLTAETRRARKAARDVRAETTPSASDARRLRSLEQNAAEIREGITRYAAAIEASGEQVPKATQRALDKLKSKLADTERQIADISSKPTVDESTLAPSVRERRAAAEARRQRKEENRRAAEEERQAQRQLLGDPSLSRQQRVDRLADLNLPSSAAAFRDMAMRRGDSNQGLRLADLRRIATSFTEEGYPVQFNQKSTKEQLTSGILEARKQYEAAGERTVHDLTTAGNTIATKVDAGLRRMMSRIIKAATDSVEQATARDYIGRDIRAGGGLRFDV